jgi:hypothetical protein
MKVGKGLGYTHLAIDIAAFANLIMLIRIGFA